MTSSNVWETPDFIEIDMSAEIGGYQGDHDERPERPGTPEFVQTLASAATRGNRR